VTPGEALANLTLFILFATLLFAIVGMHLLSGFYHPWPEHGANGEPYGDNSATLWGRLVGNGTYDTRMHGNEHKIGYNVTDLVTKGLIPRRSFEDFPRAFLLAFQVCHYMTQPLVELYAGCMVALKVAWCGIAAFLLASQIMTGDDWVNQMHDYMEARAGSAVVPLLFFANFAFCNFVALSLFIAVILENFAVAEGEKMRLQKAKAESEAEAAARAKRRPKVSFAHRLAWLCGGEGGRAGKLDPLFYNDGLLSLDYDVAREFTSFREQCEALFRDLDTDGDGVLSVAEIQAGIAKIERGTGLARDARKLFKEADADRDGRMTADELHAFLRREMGAEGLEFDGRGTEHITITATAGEDMARRADQGIELSATVTNSPVPAVIAIEPSSGPHARRLFGMGAASPGRVCR
jgi:hypothetical protein